MVATLGLRQGVFQSGSIVVTGLPAWMIHRGYHVLAVPTWERKIRVLAVWLTALMFGRGIALGAATAKTVKSTGGAQSAR